jgi:hypothetical protein
MDSNEYRGDSKKEELVHRRRRTDVGGRLSIDNTHLAALVFNGAITMVVLFQLALALGVPWGEFGWGGAYVGMLPPLMRLASLASIILLLGFATLVSIRAGLLLPHWQAMSRTGVWFVVAYCAVGVVANALTPSENERLVWLPVAVVLLGSSTIVATS